MLLVVFYSKLLLYNDLGDYNAESLTADLTEGYKIVIVQEDTKDIIHWR